MGSYLVRVWAVSLFFLILACSLVLFLSLPFDLYSGIICYFPRISFHDSNIFVIYSDSRSALQALGSLHTRSPLVLKIQRFLCDLHGRRKFLLLLEPSHVGLSGNEKADVLAKRTIQLPQANHNALPLQDYVPSICRSIRASWQSRWNQCFADDSKLAQLEPSIRSWSSCSQ